MTDTNVTKEIRRAVDTGRVVFGTRIVEKNILSGEGKIVVIANSMPSLEKERIVHEANIAKVPLYEFDGTAKELGTICGKPFIISSLLVKNVGKSKIVLVVN